MTTRPASGLLEALQQIPDPRGRQGLRHPLPAMLAAVVCAVMSGYSSYTAIAQWIHSREVAFWHLIGFTRRPPKEDAFRKLLNRLDPQEVEHVLCEWLEQVEGLADEDRRRKTRLVPRCNWNHWTASRCGARGENGSGLVRSSR